MIKYATIPALLALLLNLGLSFGAELVDPAVGGSQSLDLRVLKEDMPAAARLPASASESSNAQLPNLGAQRAGTPGFRSDLPYGSGYEARRGRGAGSGSASGAGGGMGRGRRGGGGRGR